jgi:hypothetical protein
MKFRGKDLQVGNGIRPNGFLENGVFKQWGVQKYPELWGASGKAIEKAHQLLQKHQLTNLTHSSKSLNDSLLRRKEDMKKYAAKRKCKGSCPPRLNCKDCVSREQHEHMYTLINDSRQAIEALLQDFRA